MTEQPDQEQDNGAQPVGEIDISTAPALRSALAEALVLLGASRADRIVTDFSQVTFCDSSGLNALVAARLEAVRAEAAIHLSNPAPQLQRLLQMTGADSLFPREDELPARSRRTAGA